MKTVTNVTFRQTIFSCMMFIVAGLTLAQDEPALAPAKVEMTIPAFEMIQRAISTGLIAGALALLLRFVVR